MNIDLHLQKRLSNYRFRSDSLFIRGNYFARPGSIEVRKKAAIEIPCSLPN